MQKIKVILVDDHNIVRKGVKILLMNLPDIEVIGEAADSNSLFDLLPKNKPDILLLDIVLPDISGITIVKKINTEYPDIKVIMLTANDNEEFVYESMRAGALGYLPKDILQEELIEAIRTVNEGNEYIAKSITSAVMKNYMVRSMLGKTYKFRFGKDLSFREIEIIKLISEGFKYKEIADKLNISFRTVETHKNNILEKLGLNSVIELVRFAIKNKISKL